MFTDLEEWFAELDQYDEEPFMAEGRRQPATPKREVFHE
jgi:Fe-S-cluster formation regulator IscX/YfhJ